MMSVNLGPGDYERALTAIGLNDINVFHRQTTGSTNDDARASIGSGPSLLDTPVAIFVAEAQTRGRGRGSNAWSSPKGSISLTITAPGVHVSRLGILPLGVGTAVVGALRALGVSATVKWPNDVLIEGRKVCGILCESSLHSGIARVFIGIGINVEADSIELEAAPRATALSAHGLDVNRPALVADITGRVLSLIHAAAPGPSVILDWKAVSVPWWGEAVRLIDGGTEKTVTLLDVNPEGQLVVRDEAGIVRSLVSGEVREIRVVSA
ncbi:MAG: biotin--[acetyl-CoA-carboxylase] ligase [Vicinamibacteria bacterium]|nr:biotin--[acetyl-CoA-carboxylase] ligase [Vicinamibacteria bacterium]